MYMQTYSLNQAIIIVSVRLDSVRLNINIDRVSACVTYQLDAEKPGNGGLYNRRSELNTIITTYKTNFVIVIVISKFLERYSKANRSWVNGLFTSAASNQRGSQK